ncbi:hypothetical protein BESB_008100 [Besnoitia besnoiti]|uniref:Uncharacterized protein n=1 Tax=Besnoitia besnoiti TaxID=94643 RepID=A0A2A9MIU8_BESBE|nr:hypothetical protein BESB_008100 [Besnoitia besnoiti]PFH38468.1 hypothetical protein BESB_008100 [Besnoitia besnoiti]
MSSSASLRCWVIFTHKVFRSGIQSYESRFTETTLPQVPGPGGIVGDVSPSQFPVINLHMDIPNTDILEEQFLEKERDDMDRELNEVEGDYNRGLNGNWRTDPRAAMSRPTLVPADFFQIAAFQVI